MITFLQETPGDGAKKDDSQPLILRYRYEPFISSLCLNQKGKHIGCPSAEDTRGGC